MGRKSIGDRLKRRERLNKEDMQLYMAVQSVINRFIDELARLDADTDDIAQWAAMSIISASRR